MYAKDPVITEGSSGPTEASRSRDYRQQPPQPHRRKTRMYCARTTGIPSGIMHAWHRKRTHTYAPPDAHVLDPSSQG